MRALARLEGGEDVLKVDNSVAETREVPAAAGVSEQVVTVDAGNLLEVLQAAASWAKYKRYNGSETAADRIDGAIAGCREDSRLTAHRRPRSCATSDGGRQ
jgi:hypothetical protein